MFKGSVASEDLGQVVRALKGAAEPTRLRLLVLLSHGEFTVGELASILRHSQPRISRHLRLLTEAGFLDRFREQQCVYYRMPVTGQCLQWSRQILSLLDPDAALLRRDRDQAARVAEPACGDGRPAGYGRTGVPRGALAAAGRGAGSLWDRRAARYRYRRRAHARVLGPRAEHAVGIDISAPALRLARTRVHGAGLSHCELRRGDMYGLPYEDAAFDTRDDRASAGAGSASDRGPEGGGAHAAPRTAGCSSSRTSSSSAAARRGQPAGAAAGLARRRRA